MDRAEIRLKCVDLAMNIQAQRSADAVVAQARLIEAYVVAPEQPVAIVPVERAGDVATSDPDPVAVPVPKKSNRAY
jgi:hypothetical protein